MSLSASVVVVTYNRPDYLGRCLQHLKEQKTPAQEILVVDASPGNESEHLVRERFPSVRYFRNDKGRGTTATSRNIAFNEAISDIIAFVDDDADAAPDWLENLLSEYSEPGVGGVGGRARNGEPGEERIGLDEVGLLRSDGTLSGNFAADPGHSIDVDHLLGANMSWRRQVLLDNGGIHDHYPGTCLREESDIALRARRAGWRIVYAPTSVVDHHAGPYAKGRRFDLRYRYYANRNHIVLLTVAAKDPSMLRAFRRVALRGAFAQLQVGLVAGLHGHGRPLAGGILKAAIDVFALCVGTAVAKRLHA